MERNMKVTIEMEGLEGAAALNLEHELANYR